MFLLVLEGGYGFCVERFTLGGRLVARGGEEVFGDEVQQRPASEERASREA